MNIDEIKKEVIYSESQSRLFEITIELTEELSKLHIELTKTEDPSDKARVRGKISLLSVLQNIIDKRIEDVKAIERDSERKELLSNRQFRKVAETVLTKETYERITELCLINYKKFRDLKTELKANKLE